MADKYWIGNKPDKSVSTVAESGTAAGVDIGGIVKLSKTLAFGDFTDGGSTAGTFTFGESIPAGAVFLRAVATTVTGFAGDTSATITIGDGTDVDLSAVAQHIIPAVKRIRARKEQQQQLELI